MRMKAIVYSHMKKVRIHMHSVRIHRNHVRVHTEDCAYTHEAICGYTGNPVRIHTFRKCVYTHATHAASAYTRSKDVCIRIF